MAQRYFATINPGLEEALLAEVRELGGKRAKVRDGGVEFEATNTVFYRTAYRLRCANRLWLRIDDFRARDAPELFNKTKRIDWSRLIPRDVAVAVRGAAHNSRLIHTDRISRAVSDGIDASLERERVTSGPALAVLARLVDDRCELSLDATGDLLYRRGYKTDAVAAPLRESVASAVLRIVGWEPGQTLFDPFCGGGTLVIEAAQRAAGIAASSGRDLDLHQWANYRPDLWEDVVAEQLVEPTAGAFFGADVDVEAVTAARHNAERAGVAQTTVFTVADATQCEPPDAPPGWIVTNPPWNLRLPDPDNVALRAFLDRFAQHFAGWRAAVIAPRRWQPNQARRQARFKIGGVPVTLWVFENRGA